MSEPTKEQQEKFWKRCGFEWDEKYGHWNYPDGSPHSQLPKLTGIEALGNMFKYAVPRFKEICASRIDYVDLETCDNDTHIFLRHCEKHTHKGAWTKEGWMCILQGFRTSVLVEGADDPALALFWVLRKVMND